RSCRSRTNCTKRAKNDYRSSSTRPKQSWKTVAILNPEHLFEQADRLVVPPQAGPPRQVAVRRAISAAYYGVFHATLTAAADHFVGSAKRGTRQYGLVHRSVQHGALRSLCEVATKPRLAAKYVPHVPNGSFGNNISAFAAAAF